MVMAEMDEKAATAEQSPAQLSVWRVGKRSDKIPLYPSPVRGQMRREDCVTITCVG